MPYRIGRYECRWPRALVASSSDLKAMKNQLERDFDEAMLAIYRRAKGEAQYDAKIFLWMVVEKGGAETARYLLNTEKVSDGYTALWQRGRLDLTVEAVILDKNWWPLFTSEQRRTAIQRLKEYRFSGSLPDPGTV